MLAAISAFFSAHRLIFVATSLTALIGIVVAHLAFDQIRKNKLATATESITKLRASNSSCRLAVDELNKRIEASNLRQQEALAAAAARLKQAEDLAAVAAAQRDAISEELEITRFEVLESIRDDETMADWVDWDVPPVAWDRLRDAAEGRMD